MAERYIAMDYLLYDAVRLPAGGQVSVFAERQGVASESAVALAEPELVDTLLGIPQVRHFLLAKWGLSDYATYRTRVVQPFVEEPNRKPGDIDLFAADSGHPDQAVVSELKKVKVRSGSSELDQRVNGLDGATDGVLQANALGKMEFSRTWLSLLVIADGRGRTNVNMAFRGPSGRTIGRIYDFAQCFRLDPGIGLCVIESVQTTNCSIDTCGAVGFGVLRAPAFRKQSTDLTSKVQRFVRYNPMRG